MVKPDYKVTEKVQTVVMEKTSEKDKMDDDACDEEIVIFDEARRRKRPHTCTFIVLLLLVLLVGFLVVYLVDKWKLNKIDHKDSVDQLPTPVPTLWQFNVSWETQEELFHLSDVVDQNNLMGLRPIFRKDLPRRYIAYWEVKVSVDNKEKYLIVSAAKQTGDHRLAEEGTLPSPSDFLTEQARRNGHQCHKVYRLTPDGLTVCEDTQLRRIVASTRNIDSNSELVDWRKLDRQVSRSLPQFARDWEELGRRVKKTPQWNRFKWLSMDTDEVTSVTPTITEEAESKGHDEADDHETETKVKSTSGFVDAEIGLRPGDSVRIPLGNGFTDVRIKFVDFRHRHLNKNRWQKRLCRVLSNICNGGSSIVKSTSTFFKQTPMGDRFIRIKVHSDERFVKKQLQGHEIRFQVELSGRKSSAVIVINYGIILKSQQLRRGRSVNSDLFFGVPHEELFPDYRQHHNGQCLTGSGAVAWAMVLGYYGNLARRAPELKLKFTMTSRATSLPINTTRKVERFTNTISKILDTRCTKEGAGVTTPGNMKRIKKWVRENIQQDLPIITRRENAERNSSTATLLVKLLKEGVPVIISKQRDDANHHYVVATRLRQRSRVYRACDETRGTCSGWTFSTVSEVFVHQGLGKYGNRWENADTHFVAALIAH